MIRIYLVDDQTIVREGLRAILHTEPDFNVVGEAGNGMQAVSDAPRLKPDVILLDIRMPGLDGLATLAQLKRVIPEASIIMLTLYDQPDYLLQAITAGAAGYVLKDSTHDELVRAIRVTREGGAMISPSMLPELLKYVQKQQPRAVANCDIQTLGNLTAREVEILKLIVQGHTNQQIAEVFFLSPATVKTHVQNILHKLGVSDRTQAAVFAVRCGLL